MADPYLFETDMDEDSVLAATMRELKEVGCTDVEAGFFGGGGGTLIGVRCKVPTDKFAAFQKMVQEKWELDVSLEGQEIYLEYP